MASAPAPTHRASLLSGLRTGGVRSNPITGVPHTAAPGASFNMPSRFTPATYNKQSYGEEDDQLSDMLSNNMYINPQQRTYQPPVTAAVDGGANRFAHQQGQFSGGMMSGMPHSNPAVGNTQLQAQQQALQMQLMQLELIRMQVCSPSRRFLFSVLISLSGSASPATASRATRAESPAEWSIIHVSCFSCSHYTVIRSSSDHSERLVASAQPGRLVPFSARLPE